MILLRLKRSIERYPSHTLPSGESLARLTSRGAPNEIRKDLAAQQWPSIQQYTCKPSNENHLLLVGSSNQLVHLFVFHTSRKIIFDYLTMRCLGRRQIKRAWKYIWIQDLKFF